MNAPADIAVDSAPRAVVGKYRLRVRDYLLLDERGSFGNAETELVDGDVTIMSPEWMPHMRIKDELAYRLRRTIEALGLALRVGTGGSVQLSEVDQPRPDIIVMHPADGDKAVPLDAVVLLVEVSSSTLAYDLNEKGGSYARADVPEYWTVDLNAYVIHRWSRPTRKGYTEHQEVAFGQPLASATINGLRIDTAGLLKR